MEYRREIDGLRAIAVLSVILFHANVSLFSGGFVGVDVFFVISGYLITRLILEELENSRFSLLNFYERRARRILPALFLVMAACLPLAWYMLLPIHMERFSASLMGVSLFFSNIIYYNEVGYFADAAELKPLMHSWSLAVEEQYYILFPLLIAYVGKFGRRPLILVVTVFAVVSFGVAQWWVITKPDAAFYLLPARGWELLMGSLVAIYMATHDRTPWSPVAREICAITGLMMLAFSVFAFDGTTPFPGFCALLPTIGAATIIVYATPGTLVGRILGMKALVGGGLISYGAYLWHYPLFSFARYVTVDAPDSMTLVWLTVLSIFFAILSWRYVENRFRNRRYIGRFGVLVFGLVGTTFFAVVGAAGTFTEGFAYRGKWGGLENQRATLKELGSGEKYCREHAIKSRLGPLVCVIGDLNSLPEGVLWGDSFAGALTFGLDAQLKIQRKSFYFVSSDGCIPIESSSRISAAFGCAPGRQDQFVREVAGLDSIKTVVWVGSFAYLTGYQGGDFLIGGIPSTPELVKSSVLGTLEKLKNSGKEVVLVGDGPRFPRPAAEYAMKMFLLRPGDPVAMVQTISREQLIHDYGNLAETLDEAGSRVAVVDGLDVFCNTDTCSSHDANGKLLFVDGAHLSHLGSVVLAKEVMRKLQ